MESQTSPLFLLYGIAIGQFLLLLLVVLMKRNKDISERYLLVGLIFTMVVIIAEFLLTWSGYLVYAPWIMGISYSFSFLLGPLLLGIVWIYNQKKLSILHSYHLIPFFATIIFQFSFFNVSNIDKIDYYQSEIVTEEAFKSIRYIQSVFLKSVHLVIYVVLVWIMVHQEKLRWTKIHQSIWLVLGLVSMLYFIHATLLYFELPFYALTYCVIIALMGILGFWLQWIYIIPNNANPSIKYEKSGLSTQILDKEAQRVITEMEEKRLYLNPDLKLSSLSDALDLSPHHLSQIINQQLGKNFSEFVNEFRVHFAQKLLCDSSKDRTIQQIGFESGFNSKNSFHRSFRKIVGHSPSEFRKSFTSE